MAKLKGYDYEYFFNSYFVIGKNTNEIAKDLNASGSSVVRKMRGLGIELGLVTVLCTVCGKELRRGKRKVYGDRKQESFYCGKECEGKHKMGIFSGKGNPFYGLKHTDKTRCIISKANKGKEMTLSVRKKISLTLSGENNPHWKDGSSTRNKKDRLRLEYREWRTTVFKRDNYTCRKCNIRGAHLHVHHLKNYSEHKDLRFIPINGMTLCEECHAEFHHIYTRKNNTVKQILEYLGR